MTGCSVTGPRSVTGSGSCTHAGSPCPSATCVEAQDLCTCALPGESCEDNNFCNGGDFCLFGLCEHVGDPCTPQGLHCAEEIGRCICFIDAECDDLNVCTDERCETDGSCRQFVNTKPCDVVWDTTKPNGQPRRMLDTSRALAEFGWKARIGFEEGLAETVRWYEENRS